MTEQNVEEKLKREKIESERVASYLNDISIDEKVKHLKKQPGGARTVYWVRRFNDTFYGSGVFKTDKGTAVLYYRITKDEESPVGVKIKFRTTRYDQQIRVSDNYFDRYIPRDYYMTHNRGD
jgi:hypothetical protein